MSDAYAELVTRYRRVSHLEGAAGILHWDRSVMMPPGGAEVRGEQLATLAVLAHELSTDSRIGDLLQSVDESGLYEVGRANLREMRSTYAHRTAVPADLVEASSLACSRSETLWREARGRSDPSLVLPALAEVVRLAREIAQAKGDALGLDPYDALLDQFDPGRRAADIDRLFGTLEPFLRGFLPEALAAQDKRPEPLPLEGSFPAADQTRLAQRVMTAAGFDFDRGRLDESLHPFSTGVAGDARITTRWDEGDLLTGLMAVLHETGHSLYTSGLPTEWRGQPVGGDRGMTLHESQSLVLEMIAGRGAAVCEWLSGLIRETFDTSGPAWEGENIRRHQTRVVRGFIRVDADEVTYPLHVMLRTRLERALIGGTLDVRDLEEAWNEGLAEALGHRPPTAAQGFLQDIHWFDGAFGYFPTYTLGALTAAQLMAAIRRDVPDLDRMLRAGDFGAFVDWLGRHVHRRGCLLMPDDLIREATGEPLSTKAFVDHLEARYLAAA